MPPSVLLVDDDAEVRDLLCEGLRRRGFEVDAVDSAEACLHRVQAQPVDIVVTDVQMPGMSGLQLCEQLHASHPQVLPIVVTGLKDAAAAFAAQSVDAFEFMTKPVNVAAVDAALRRAFDHLSLKGSGSRSA